MTLDEFLRWDDGTDTRYELVRRVPVPRPLQPNAHGMLIARLCALINPSLEARQKHFGLLTLAVASSNDPATCYLADFLVAPLPIQWDRQLAHEPVLIIEVLSDSTEEIDRGSKLPDYRDLESVQEILLIDSRRCRAELHQRRGFDWRTRIISERSGAVSLASVSIEISMSELYEGSVFPEDEEVPIP